MAFAEEEIVNLRISDIKISNHEQSSLIVGRLVVERVGNIKIVADINHNNGKASIAFKELTLLSLQGMKHKK